MRASPCTIGHMKRDGVVVGVVLLLALTGCSQTPQDAADAPSTAETTAPLVAESLSPQGATEDTTDAFLTQVRDTLPDATSIPDATDEQLLAAGQDGCDQAAAGVPSDDISVIEGEERDQLGYYRDTSVIVVAAVKYICPEMVG